jgi:uncharacterized protein YjbJ (UPF0337 family)
MDENSIAGSINEVKDAAKVAIGEAVGEARLRSDGRADKAIGRIRNYAGSLSDAVREAEAMKSAGLLVASSINRDTGP